MDELYEDLFIDLWAGILYMKVEEEIIYSVILRWVEERKHILYY